MKSEGEVKVAKSARGKTSLEGSTCTAAHAGGPPPPPLRCSTGCVLEKEATGLFSPAPWLVLPPGLASLPLLGVEFCHSRTPHMRCLLPFRQHWGIYACRCWKPKYFQNKCRFVGFPIYRLLEDNPVGLSDESVS